MRMSVFGLRMILTAALLACWLSTAGADNWPRFRGPNGTGVSHDKDIPIQFGEKSGILWKIELPGIGNSSPVVWGQKLFVQASSSNGKERMLLCLDVTNGKTLWKQSVPGTAAHKHLKSSWASSTPATDGQRVCIVFWNGDALALHAYDLEGKPLWTYDLGKFTSQHGAGASPVFYDGKVFLNHDQDGAAAVIALDAATGKVAWQAPRKAFRACYSTPFLHETPGNPPELVVSSTAGLTGYDPKSGAIIWNWDWTTFEGMALRTVGSPIASNGLILATSGDGSGARHAVALRAGGKGDVTQTHLVWEEKRRVFPYVPTMLTLGEHVYSIQDQIGMAQCHVAKTGQLVWDQRLGGPFAASPVLIDGKVYAVSEEGTVFVFPAQPKFELLAKNPLGERVIASPAVADNRLFIRGQKHLFCIGNPPAR